MDVLGMLASDIYQAGAAMQALLRKAHASVCKRGTVWLCDLRCKSFFVLALDFQLAVVSSWLLTNMPWTNHVYVILVSHSTGQTAMCTTCNIVSDTHKHVQVAAAVTAILRDTRAYIASAHAKLVQA
jgi:hypothetical protein